MKTFHILFQKTLFFLILVSIILTGCDSLTLQGPQPDYIEEAEYEPLLNVLGVLRPDSLDVMPKSFIHLESTYPADNVDRHEVIYDADVVVTIPDQDNVLNTYTMMYTSMDLFEKEEYRHPDLFVKGGEFCTLTCEKEGYPLLRAYTTVPSVPEIPDESIVIEDGFLSFQILRDEKTGLYEVMLQGKNWTVSDRKLRSVHGPVNVELSFPAGGEDQIQLTVYAFDLNLSEYLTVNLSIKPNIYQSDFTTVENGFGCFGSLNILKKNIPLE